MKTPDYVVGLMFDETKKRVALIRKIKPQWQAGKLNGCGGSLEDFDPDSHSGMIREWEEETGMKTSVNEWSLFLTMRNIGKAWNVFCFFAIGDVDALKSMEDEKIEIVDISEIIIARPDMVPNLCWMVGLALDCQDGSGPIHTEAVYLH